jgi:phosphocarrier protein|tara:strand:- start:55 stop:336 length:282 start_codon:yes stop_codon:yes gene_type:complete
VTVADPQSQSIIITHNLGLHLRAAGALVQAAAQYKAEIIIRFGSLNANGKSIMSVLSLAAPCGAELTISATGEDSESAITAIAELVKNDFGIE